MATSVLDPFLRRIIVSGWWILGVVHLLTVPDGGRRRHRMDLTRRRRQETLLVAVEADKITITLHSCG